MSQIKTDPEHNSVQEFTSDSELASELGFCKPTDHVERENKKLPSCVAAMTSRHDIVHNICSIQGCSSDSTSDPDLGFFKLPDDIERKTIWLEIIKQQCGYWMEEEFTICEKHFEEKYVFMVEIKMDAPYKRLCTDAVPSIFPAFSVSVPKSDTPAAADMLHVPDVSSNRLIESDELITSSDPEQSYEPDVADESLPTIFSMPSDSVPESDMPVAADMRDILDVPHERDAPYRFSKADELITTGDPEQTYKPDLMEKSNESYAACSSPYAPENSNKRQLNAEYECNKRKKLAKTQDEPHQLTIFIDDDDDEDQDETFIKDGDFLPKSEDQILLNRKPKQRYTFEFKMLALQLYFKYPSCYRLLQSYINLPRISTLYRLYIPTSTELSLHLLNALKVKVDSMTPVEKQCTVCIATMSLTPRMQYDTKGGRLIGFHELNNVQRPKLARTVLVVMVRGLFHNWKQAVAYAYLSSYEFKRHEKLKLHIDRIIVQLFRIGLNVRAFMTDLETDIMRGTDGSTVTAGAPYMIINNKKVLYMYDPLNLMNNMCKHLAVQNFMFDKGMVANWGHIRECYRHDRKRDILRLIPNLSFNNVHPSKDVLDEVNTVSDIFNKETAKGIAAYISMGVLSSSARETQEWILTMCKLMEMLNFSTLHSADNKSAVFSGEKEQVDFLMDMLCLFEYLRLLKVRKDDTGILNSIDVESTKSAKFIEGFKVTIIALLILYGDLKSENCWHPIVGLSRDHLTEFFMKVLKKYDASPTVEQMTTCIKTFPIVNIFQYNVKNKHSNDLQNFLTHVAQVPRVNMLEQTPPSLDFIDLCAEESKEFDSLNLLTVSKMNHLALYLLYKTYQQHSGCHQMRRYVVRGETLKISYKTADGGKINSIPFVFKQFIKALDLKFTTSFKEKVPSMAELIKSMKPIEFFRPCECFPVEFVIQLYLRFRLFFLSLYNNNSLKINRNSEFTINML